MLKMDGQWMDEQWIEEWINGHMNGCMNIRMDEWNEERHD